MKRYECHISFACAIRMVFFLSFFVDICLFISLDFCAICLPECFSIFCSLANSWFVTLNASRDASMPSKLFRSFSLKLFMNIRVANKTSPSNPSIKCSTRENYIWRYKWMPKKKRTKWNSYLLTQNLGNSVCNGFSLFTRPSASDIRHNFFFIPFEIYIFRSHKIDTQRVDTSASASIYIPGPPVWISCFYEAKRVRERSY